MNKYYVYLHKDADDNVVYVGQGSGRRWIAFNKSKSKKYLKALALNGGIFKSEKLFTDLTKDEALKLELETYLKYKDTGLLLNGRQPSSIKYVDYSLVSNLIEYDETSPTFLRWKVSRKNAPKGKIAGSNHSSGYCEVRINLQLYLAHRIVWVLNGNTLDNSMVIDHIDGNKKNNCIANLRQVSQQHNSQNNPGIRSNNSTGYVGVSFQESKNRYIASWTDGKINHKKHFSCNILGKENALNAAIHHRLKAIEQMNESGADYTSKHQNL